MNFLSPQDIHAALSLLNDKLAAREVQGEICLFGGAVMALVYDARQSTRDVDAIMVPKTELTNAAIEVAEEMNLPAAWLNDGVKGFVSSQPELTSEGLPKFSHLRLFCPTPTYLLAMKCLAARADALDHSGDKADVQVLCRHLGLSTATQVLEIVQRYYPADRLPVKTQYFIAEAIGELSQS